MTNAKYILISKEKEFDVFTDGHCLYVGIFNPVSPSIAIEIANNINWMNYLKPKDKNKYRKKVAKAREYTPVDILHISSSEFHHDWDSDEKRTIVGTAWSEGTMDFIDSTGESHYGFSIICLPTDKNIKLFNELQEGRKALDLAVKHVKKIIEKLEANSVSKDVLFKKLLGGD